MDEVTNKVWCEKYRPKCLDDLILSDIVKQGFLKYKDNPNLMPNFIFHSSRPGTGKTSTAHVLAKEFGCDFEVINSSDERGIDTIRDKVKNFAQSMSFNNFKRCMFLDEADGATKIAQDSLRNLMETYSSNCFFILSCNDLSKIIEPLRSRCTCISYEKPDTTQILSKLQHICKEEDLEITEDELFETIDAYYPDIRSMTSHLATRKIVGSWESPQEHFEEFYQCVKNQETQKIYRWVYEKNLNLEAFNKWLFHKVFSDGAKDLQTAINLLAENEKGFVMGVNREIIFISTMVAIGKHL